MPLHNMSVSLISLCSNLLSMNLKSISADVAYVTNGEGKYAHFSKGAWSKSRDPDPY